MTVYGKCYRDYSEILILSRRLKFTVLRADDAYFGVNFG